MTLTTPSGNSIDSLSHVPSSAHHPQTRVMCTHSVTAISAHNTPTNGPSCYQRPKGCIQNPESSI